VLQDGYNRKGLISENGEGKKAFYVLQSFYRELMAPGSPVR
jgi:beta-glucuronidase